MDNHFADERRRADLELTVLEGLLYLASNKGESQLPSMWEFITSEIIGAVYEHLTGEEFEEEYRKFRGPGDDHWFDVVNRHLKVLDSQNRFSKSLADALKYWLKLEWDYDHGESSWEGNIRHWFLFGFRQGCNSTFALTVPEAKQFEAELQKLDPDTRKHLESIAEIMKKYMKRDLDHIKEHFQW